jgi:hypothetical protein
MIGSLCAIWLATTIALGAPAAVRAAQPSAAADPVSAPAASSRPSTTALEADFSSPKSAAATLFHAISRGDRGVIARGLYAADDEQRALANAMADLLVNGKRLGDAARERFGKDSDPIAAGMLDPADLSRLDAATVKQSADTATLEVPDQSRPMSFRKSDGRWQLVVTDFAAAAPQNIARQTRLVRMMAEAMDESAREISAGKYKTVEPALTAFQKRLHEVMLEFTRPATTRAAGATTQATQP